MGPSLAKIAAPTYGNDPAGWANGPGGGTPGSANGSSVPGDVTGDGLVNAADIDAVHAAINAGSTNPAFDLDGNSMVNAADATYLIETILGTRRGDANLDGVVARSDAAIVARNFGYTGTPAWAKGDYDGNGQVDLADVAITQANLPPAPPAPPAAPSAPAAVIAAAGDGATRVATRRTSGAVRVIAPAADGVDAAISAVAREPSDDASSRGDATSSVGGLRIRAARHRAALSAANMGEVDLSEIATEVRRIRRR
jgi:hypothetical protein